MIDFYKSFFVRNNLTPSAKAHCSCLCSVFKIQVTTYNAGVSEIQITDNKFNSYFFHSELNSRAAAQDFSQHVQNLL